jgi:hypothetical protein
VEQKNLTRIDRMDKMKSQAGLESSNLKFQISNSKAENRKPKNSFHPVSPLLKISD